MVKLIYLILTVIGTNHEDVVEVIAREDFRFGRLFY